jgi:SAM-dependent methyltransferase
MDPSDEQLQVFFSLHRGLPQQAPGSDASTRRAFELLPGLPAQPRILDIGCGPGRQSLALARLSGGSIVAVDILPFFLEELRERAEKAGLGDHIETRQCSMLELELADESFDLIWSEGAIYNMGFEAGLRAWRRWLRPGGGLAVSEASWLSESRSRSAREFWAEHYPAMTTREVNRARIADAGYELADDFALPAREWWDDYYTPLEQRIASRSPGATEAERLVLGQCQQEIDIFRESRDCYGYVFYVMRRTD